MNTVRKRRSIRMKEYDYTMNNRYFVTICSYKKQRIFGEVVDEEVVLNEVGKIVESCWNAIPEHFPYVVLGDHVVMPNHFHGLLEIGEVSDTSDMSRRGKAETLCCVSSVDVMKTPDDSCRGVACYAPTTEQSASTSGIFRSPPRGSLGTIIRSFKSAVTKRVNELQLLAQQPIWQRSYYEHIIRSDRSLRELQRYIHENPSKWFDDPEYV